MVNAYNVNLGKSNHHLNHFFFQPQQSSIIRSPGVPRPGLQGQHIIVQRMNSIVGPQNTVPSTMNNFGLPIQIRTQSGVTIQKATVMTGL